VVLVIAGGALVAEGVAATATGRGTMDVPVGTLVAWPNRHRH
jgi:hypothetical protein